MNKKCLGCGIPMQDTDNTKSSYTKSLDMDYCMRCFRITHYHDLDFKNENINGEKIIKSLYGKKGFAFFFVDFLNISKESISYYKQINMPKCFVISKSDTIPKSIYFPKIKEWLKKYFEITETILFLEKNSNTSVKKVIQIMEEQNSTNFYMVGMTNAGKSTFLNKLLNNIENKKNNLTVSEKPNTTLDFIRINTPFGTIFDTAGIPYSYYPCKDELLKKANIEKEIKPITYPMKKNMGLILENEIRIEIDTDSSVTFFKSNNIEILKVYEKNERLKDFIKVELNINANSNVLIKGFCFFYIKESCTVTIYGVEENMIELMPSYLGASYE